MVVFTICARNFLAQALVLHESLLRHHPDATFHVALCDSADDLDPLSYPFTFVVMDELGIPRLPEMIARYNITELNTAIKPFVFAALFDRFPGQAVVYVDPDILIVSRLVELETVIAGGADCVLTPHLCEPGEFAEMHDGRILQYGIYNLGFVALRDTPNVRRVAAWWGRRLELHCVVDLAAGLFVDQRWAEHLPAFIERTVILRHPGYNVAYWNLSQRTVRRDRSGGSADWRVNDEPLRFVHFSGSQLDGTPVFSRHSGQFPLSRLGDLGALFREYVADAHAHGLAYFRTVPYAFRWDGASGDNLHTPAAVAQRRVATADDSWHLATEPLPHLPLVRTATLAAHEAARDKLGPLTQARRASEDRLVPPDRDPFELEGHCVVCGAPRRFRVGSLYSGARYPGGRPVPNWREHLDCDDCGFTNRLRATLHVLAQDVRPNPGASVYLTEHVTRLFRWFADRFVGTTGSEYLGPDHASGVTVGGVRHEDVQALSFADGSFDLIVSLEVLEHVPFPERALSEFRRCLRPGGTLLLTVPFHQWQQAHEVRARMLPDGSIEHLMSPEYHGNPVDSDGGSLCYRYFGWDLMDDLRSAGFARAECLTYWSRRFGYLGPTNGVIVAAA